MINVNILNKSTGVDEETFQPYLEATITVRLPLEAMSDASATGELNKVYKMIGKAISDELAKQ